MNDPSAVHLDLPLPGGTGDAVLALPDGDVTPGLPPAAYPGVLFIMDAVGLRPCIVEMARRIAGQGYAVLVPNVFYRAGRSPLVDPALLAPDRRDDRMARFGELFGACTPADWALDGPAYLDHLAARPETRDEPVRVVGYCMGGRLGIALAAQCPDRVAAVAAFHPGGLVSDGPDSAHLLLPEVRARIYLGFADNDRSATPEAQATFAAAAAEAGRDYRGELYSGAAHGYTMSDLPAYDAAACDRHWAALFATFAG
jgi:carboxymethylenebutenolidase